MREIKFRGKSIQTGEWVYGGYVKHQTHTLAPLYDPTREPKPVPEYQHLILKSGFSDWNMAKPLEMHEVKEETVGEFTGLRDKNGVEIFEGDIGFFSHSPQDIGAVQWVDAGLWFVKQDKTYYNMRSAEFQIIGNIHENSELLK